MRSCRKRHFPPLYRVERQQAGGTRVAFRADAAFARPAIYETLEQRDVDYAIRIPANKSLERDIEDIVFRPPGRPSRKPLVRDKSFAYQAKSWTRPRRIVAKVEHHWSELFPRVGFIVTNMVLPSRSVVRFNNKRGTAEQWVKEGKQATPWTRLSCHRFRANEVRLQLGAGLQPGHPLAQTGSAATDHTLVAHESPAAAGENRRPAGDDWLERERDRLRRENDRLKHELDLARRAGKRQAAPFSKGPPTRGTVWAPRSPTATGACR